MRKMIKAPKPGQKIYVPGAMYVYRGKDDFAGGIATINKVEVNHSGLPEDHPNYIFVTIEERPGVKYNWKELFRRQDELKAQLGDQKAHPDPDLRAEFNDENADWK